MATKNETVNVKLTKDFESFSISNSVRDMKDRPVGTLSVKLKANGEPDVAESPADAAKDWVRINVQHKTTDVVDFVLWAGEAKAVKGFTNGSKGKNWVFNPVQVKITKGKIIPA